MRVHQASTVKGNFCNKLRLLSFVTTLGSVLIASTNGFETDCGLDDTTEPCMVFSYDDLKNITKNGLDRNYLLMNDIQAPSNPRDNFTPIGGNDGGDGTTPFTGSFDGDGHAIYDLYIDDTKSEERSSRGESGLFASLGGGSKVCNLSLEDAIVVGTDKVGALVGAIPRIYWPDNNAKIENVVIANPNVTGRTVGGLLGSASSCVVSGCHVRGGTMKGGGGSVGGLAGLLVESNAKGSSAENVNVSSGGSCGGLVGYSDSNFENSFATGNISSCYRGGCAIGRMDHATEVQNSYADCTLKDISSTLSGALAGEFESDHSGIVVNNFAVVEYTDVPAKEEETTGECLIGKIYYGANDIENNYCFKKDKVGGASSTPGITVVKSLDHFFNETNQPMAKWSPPWILNPNQYPMLSKFVAPGVVDAGGPYEGSQEDPLSLDFATSPKADYLWTVIRNSWCAFDDPTVLHPVLTCNTKLGTNVEVCLAAKFDEERVQQDCTTARFDPPFSCVPKACRRQRKNMKRDLNSIRNILLNTPTLKKPAKLVKSVKRAKDILLERPLEGVDKARNILQGISRKLKYKVKTDQMSTKEQRKINDTIKRILKVVDQMVGQDCCLL